MYKLINLIFDETKWSGFCNIMTEGGDIYHYKTFTPMKQLVKDRVRRQFRHRIFHCGINGTDSLTLLSTQVNCPVNCWFLSFITAQRNKPEHCQYSVAQQNTPVHMKITLQRQVLCIVYYDAAWYNKTRILQDATQRDITDYVSSKLYVFFG